MEAQKYTDRRFALNPRGASRTTPAYASATRFYFYYKCIAGNRVSISRKRTRCCCRGWKVDLKLYIAPRHFAFCIHICDAWNKFKCLRHVCSATYHYTSSSRPQSLVAHTLLFASLAGLKNPMKRLPMNKVDALWLCYRDHYFRRR